MDPFLIILLVVLTLGVLVYFIYFRRVKSFSDTIYVMKYRGGNLIGTQVGGEFRLLPIIERVQTLDLSPQTLKFSKRLIIDINDNLVELEGNIEFVMKNNPEKFVKLVDNKNSEDLTPLILSVMKQKIFQIVKTDIWGRTHIDLMKNEKRTLRKLEENIKYNLELKEEDLISFQIGFILN